MAIQMPTEGQIKHRDDTRRYILLPMLGGGLLIIAGLVAVALLPQRLQVSQVSDLLLTLFVLCPLVLCLLPIYLGLVAAVFGLNKVHGMASAPLTMLERLTSGLAESTLRAANSLAQRGISLSTRLAYLERLLGVFNRPPKGTGTNGQ